MHQQTQTHIGQLLATAQNVRAIVGNPITGYFQLCTLEELEGVYGWSGVDALGVVGMDRTPPCLTLSGPRVFQRVRVAAVACYAPAVAEMAANVAQAYEEQIEAEALERAQDFVPHPSAAGDSVAFLQRLFQLQDTRTIH